MNFIPICMMRGSLALVISPNTALLKLPDGLLKLGRLKKLNTSHRKVSDFDSVMRNALNRLLRGQSEQSRLRTGHAKTPAPR